jgi:hypothetical protein
MRQEVPSRSSSNSRIGIGKSVSTPFAFAFSLDGYGLLAVVSGKYATRRGDFRFNVNLRHLLNSLNIFVTIPFPVLQHEFT